MSTENYSGLSRNELEQIILEDKVEKLVANANSLGKELADDDLSKSQLRNIYATVKMVAARRQYGSGEHQEIYRLIPKLQYAAARQNKNKEGKAKQDSKMRKLSDTLTECIELIKRDQNEEEAQKRFDRFADFFEAIVAYHYNFHELRKQQKEEEKRKQKQQNFQNRPQGGHKR